jgi:hypothetical protein
MWNMGTAALGLKTDFDALQSAIDYLTCKARARMTFTSEEKDFLTSVYESFFVGGMAKGYPEAANLAAHYINGKGKPLAVNPGVYQKSVIVSAACQAIKNYIRRLFGVQGFIPPVVSTHDRSFLNSAESRTLLASGGRSAQTHGYLKNHGKDRGYLLAEQMNERLQKANNRFVLAAHSFKLDAKLIRTRWSVDDRYEFEPFEKAGFVTNIELSSSCILKLPDGLSHYMTVLGIADAFDYSSEWSENWSV